MGQTPREVVFQLPLQRGTTPLAQQLAAHIRNLVSDGKLQRGDRLPASRLIAKELGVARGTVSDAVETLIAEGVLEGKQGAGTFVVIEPRVLSPARLHLAAHREVPLNPAPEPDIDAQTEVLIDLRPCRPSVAEFPVQAWRRCMSLAASAPLSSDYGDSQGSYRLRTAICDYLRRARGLRSEPEDLIITNGSVHAMHLLTLAFLNTRSTVYFEDPGYPLARQTFASSGATIAPCSVDRDGLLLESLGSRHRGSALVYVTPSHQFPLGSRLSITRRQQLVAWSDKHNALIAEDDYDGEYRYDVPPLAPIYSLAPERVVYFGTFSKTLFPDLRIGFAVAPRPILDVMRRYRTIFEYNGNSQIQHALATFIENGSFERHILKMRRVYSKKRAAVQERISKEIRTAHVTGINSGLSFTLELDESVDAHQVHRQLTTRGVLLPTISRYCANQKHKVNGLVFGFAEPSIDQLDQGLDQLIAVLNP